MQSISKAAKKFNLSRSTLLYYDSIGILKASARSASGYRQYSDADLVRLQQICLYRKTGLPLRQIAQIIFDRAPRTIELLEARLRKLNEEILVLREQQSVTIKILKKRTLLKKARFMDKKTWVKILRAAGLNDAAMKKWHEEFEHISPENHQDFLESLHLSQEEVMRIRRWSGFQG